MLSIESNIRDWTAQLGETAREQAPFATMLALNATAFDDLKPAAEALVRQRIDRPTPFTQRAFVVIKAGKRDLVVTIRAKDIQGGYLGWLEHGGVEQPKRRAHVIATGQKRNVYGNMPKGKVRALLSRPDVFSGAVNGKGGIWKRKKRGGVQQLVKYATQARYQPMLGFASEMQRVSILAFPDRFAAAFERALATARRG